MTADNGNGNHFDVVEHALKSPDFIQYLRRTNLLYLLAMDDRTGVILGANQAMSTLLDEHLPFVGMSLRDVFSDDTSAFLPPKEGEPTNGRLRLTSRQGHVVELDCVYLRSGSVVIMVGTSAPEDRKEELDLMFHLNSDLSVLTRKLAREKKHLDMARKSALVEALHDPLTGLANRTLLDDRLSQAIATASRDTSGFWVLFLDIDRFKPINDRYGHDVGDRLLQQIGVRLTGSFRGTDTVARVGGDEFVVLLVRPGDVTDAMLAVERSHAELTRPFELDGTIVTVGVSIGIARFPEDANTGQELLRIADGRMYEAKGRGRIALGTKEEL